MSKRCNQTVEGKRIVAALTALHGNQGTISDKDLIAQLYQILSTLDGKANGLLRVNSIFMAILTAYLGFVILRSGEFGIPEFWKFVAFGALLILGGSSLFCLCVVQVSWPFLGRSTVAASGKWDFVEEQRFLAEAVRVRTSNYRWAWTLTVVAFAILLCEALAFLAYAYANSKL